MLTYRIETPRLVIRCYNPDGNDVQLLQKSINESLDHLKPWMPWAWYEPETVEAKTERVKKFRDNFDKGEDYTLGVFDLAETELIGSCGLHTRIGGNAREIGYWINVNHINKGFATEIVEALIRTGFEVEKLGRIEIRCDPKNIASARIPQKLGFIFKETLIANVKDAHGNDRDTMVWGMNAETYRLNPLASFAVKAFDKNGKRIL
jgi:RimJ/RimL family protein N-acetyltransferase